MARVMSGSSIVASHGGHWRRKQWSIRKRTLLEVSDDLLRSHFRSLLKPNLLEVSDDFLRPYTGGVNKRTIADVVDDVLRSHLRDFPKTQITVVVMDDVLRSRLESCKAHSPPWKRLRYALTASEKANAFAHYGYGWHTIGMNAGLVLEIWEAVSRLSRSTEWLRNAGDLFPQDFTDHGDMMGNIALCALHWIFNHEYAHCCRGHCLFVPESIMPTLYESSTTQPRVDPKLGRFFEVDADAAASDLLMRSLSYLKATENSEVIYTQALFAMGLVFLLLDYKQPNNLEAYEMSQHPHPFVRLLLALDFSAATALQEFHITIERARICAESAVRSLATAAVTLGYEASTWQLSPTEIRRAQEYKDTDESVHQRLQEQTLGKIKSFRPGLWSS